ncbi:sugar transferase [Patescibacteria group bacterium]|nr:sugar transferase [Patescibacteria group bacterium]MBU1966866.1 sugar transferase [Patescibacteria group bacterium]MBU2543517.1 sugar transferase [Patescibacteria group bacterium]
MLSFETQKRLLDIVLAISLFVLFFPIWVLVPLMILADSGLPIFFSHKRVGKNGKEFNLLKFRSMIQGADDLLHNKNYKLLKKFKDNDWKLQNDPRITALGKVLRSLTIDEFPQLLNVLRGEMSMVGPRAYVKKELQEQTKKYPETKKYVDYILSVKPGITGPWQTGGRNEVSFRVRAKMDALYAHKKTIWADIIILLKTPQAMISKW